MTTRVSEELVKYRCDRCGPFVERHLTFADGHGVRGVKDGAGFSGASGEPRCPKCGRVFSWRSPVGEGDDSFFSSQVPEMVLATWEEEEANVLGK